MRSPVTSLLVVLAITPALAFPASRTVHRTWRFPAPPGKRLVVDTADMDVNLRAGDVEEIVVTVDARISNVTQRQADQWLETHTPALEDSSEALKIETGKGPKGILGHLTAKATLSIVAPITSEPDIATLSGAIEVTGDFPSSSPLRLATMTGDVSFLGAAQSLTAVATSGEVRLRVVRPLASLVARTTSGDVTLSGGARQANVDTASGDISLGELSGSVRVSTSSGTVDLAWDRLGPGDQVVIRSTKGPVRLTLPPGVMPSGELRTVTGTIVWRLPGPAPAGGTTLDLPGPGPRFDIETAKSNITIGTIGVPGPAEASPVSTPETPVDR